MKLSAKEELILDLLGTGELYGLDLIERSGGNLRHGLVYVHLSRMENRGLLEARQVPSSDEILPPRRLYRATERGRAAFLTRHVELPKATLI